MQKKWLAAVLLGGCMGTGAFADVITLAADRWCPYNCTPGTDSPGFMVEIAQRIFEQAGHSVVYKVMPWTRALELVQTGEIQGAIAATHANTKDLELSLVFPVNEQARMRNVFFTTTKSTWVYRSVDSLREHHLGLVQGYAYPSVQSFIDSHPSQVQHAEGDNAVQTNIRKLAGGRVDVVLEDAAVFNYTARMAGLSKQFRDAGDDGATPASNNLYIGFTPLRVNPKSATYAKILSDGMARLRASGELAAILSAYSVTDWRHK